ncbi:MAG TPA: sulfur carrier protein ThiS [Mycobacteriales bacterium]|nr:sulfur carrier protein ThiS [Mycobacteriales bacterium]
MVVVNGQVRGLADGTTLAGLVAELAGDRLRAGVAVAVNDTVVPRDAWSGTTLGDGDRVEVLTAVQGG